MTVTLLELYRRKAGLTTRELAVKTGYIANLFSQVEHGHRRPWPVFRQKVAQALGVPEEAIFTSDGWPKTVEIDTLLKATGE